MSPNDISGINKSPVLYLVLSQHRARGINKTGLRVCVWVYVFARRYGSAHIPAGFKDGTVLDKIEK